MPKIGQNSLCPCGSGIKNKHCCLPKDQAREMQDNQDAQRKAENVIGGSATIFRHAIERADRTARENRKVEKRLRK